MPRFLQSIILVILCSFWAVPALAEASQSLQYQKAVQELSVASSSTATSISKKEKHRQKRLQRWKRKLASKCNCSTSLAPPDDPESGYDQDMRLTLLGAFLMTTGLAAFIALSFISPTALILPKILAVAVLIVGDALVCRHANVCILRVVSGFFDLFWWF